MSTIDTKLLRPTDQAADDIPPCSMCLDSAALAEPASDWITVPGYPFPISAPGSSLRIQHYFESSNEEVTTAVTRISDIRTLLRETWDGIEPKYVSAASKQAVETLLTKLWGSGCTTTVYPPIPSAGSLKRSFEGLRTGILRSPAGFVDIWQYGRAHKTPIIDKMILEASGWEEAQAGLRSAIGSKWPWGIVSVPSQMALGTNFPTRAPAISALPVYTSPMPSSGR